MWVSFVYPPECNNVGNVGNDKKNSKIIYPQNIGNVGNVGNVKKKLKIRHPQNVGNVGNVGNDPEFQKSLTLWIL